MKYRIIVHVRLSFSAKRSTLYDAYWDCTIIYSRFFSLPLKERKHLAPRLQKHWVILFCFQKSDDRHSTVIQDFEKKNTTLSLHRSIYNIGQINFGKSIA